MPNLRDRQGKFRQFWKVTLVIMKIILLFLKIIKRILDLS
jgi:ABC-type sugar transport system permease subunit